MGNKPKNFRVHVRGCGTTMDSYDYSLLKSTNSASIAVAAIMQMVDAWVNPKVKNSFLYDLACKLLTIVESEENIDTATDIRNGIDTLEDRARNWDIRESIKRPERYLQSLARKGI